MLFVASLKKFSKTIVSPFFKLGVHPVFPSMQYLFDWYHDRRLIQNYFIELTILQNAFLDATIILVIISYPEFQFKYLTF